MSVSSKIYMFLHVSVINDFQRIFDEIISDTVASGLYDKLASINIGINGGPVEHLKNIPEKGSVVAHDFRLDTYEAPTLIQLQETCMKEEATVLYVHSKNASFTRPEPGLKWSRWIKFHGREIHRRYMLYHMVYNHEAALERLGEYDTVGCDFRNEPENSSHYAGNFWWTTSSFIRKLPKMSGPRFPVSGPFGSHPRHYCERWLLCYNNADNENTMPKIYCPFWGAGLRKKPHFANSLVDLDKTDFNTKIAHFHTEQLAGRFRKSL